MTTRAKLESEFKVYLKGNSSAVIAALNEISNHFVAQGLPDKFRFPIMPRFFMENELAQIEIKARRFLSLVSQVPRLIFGGDIDRIAQEFLLPDLQARWLRQNFSNDFSELGWARPDAYIWDDTIQFMEQNLTTGIGGFSFVELVNRFFEMHPVIIELKKKFHLQPLSVIDGIAKFFDEPARHGKEVAYLDAIVPETGKVYDMEGTFLVNELQKRGTPIHYFETEKSTVKGDVVYFDGKPMQIFLRNFPGDLINGRVQELMPILGSCGAGRAEMIATPYDLILMNKLILAYLSDEQYRKYFSQSDSEFLDAVLPWTRRVLSGEAMFDSKKVDLLSLVEKNKDKFVLKKGIGWQGRLVVMGTMFSQEDWTKHLKQAVTDGDWVVQHVINAPTLELPFLVENEIIYEKVHQICAPFMFGGRLGGFSCRNSVPGGSRLLAMHGGQTGRTTVYKIADRK